jgi:hypothetical protein
MYPMSRQRLEAVFEPALFVTFSFELLELLEAPLTVLNFLTVLPMKIELLELLTLL